MKRIIVDCLRRWGWAYVFGLFLVGMIDVLWMSNGDDAHVSFMCVSFFLLPLLLDLHRGHTGVIVTLPVSRRTLARYYWCVAFVLPVLCLAGTFALAGLLSAWCFSVPSSAILWTSFAVVVLASMIWAGAICCIFTFFSPAAPGAINFVTLPLFAAFMFSHSTAALTEITKQSPVVYLGAVVLGIFLSVLSYVRSEKLVTTRTLPRRGDPKPAGYEVERIPARKPAMARFGGVFFDVVRTSFLIGLVYTTFLMLFKRRIDENPFVWPWVAAMCTVSISLFLSGSARLLRSLPLSVGQLALTLLIIPLSSFLAVAAAAGIVQCVGLSHIFGHHPASFLIPMAGAVCIASSLLLPFAGGNNRLAVMPITMIASLVIFNTVSEVTWPAAFWWILGLCLIVSAFFLNRHWLRSSNSYRPAAGDFLRRRR